MKKVLWTILLLMAGVMPTAAQPSRRPAKARVTVRPANKVKHNLLDLQIREDELRNKLRAYANAKDKLPPQVEPVEPADIEPIVALALGGRYKMEHVAGGTCFWNGNFFRGAHGVSAYTNTTVNGRRVYRSDADGDDLFVFTLPNKVVKLKVQCLNFMPQPRPKLEVRYWWWKLELRKELTSDSAPGGTIEGHIVSVESNDGYKRYKTDANGLIQLTGKLKVGESYTGSYLELGNGHYVQVEGYKGEFSLTADRPSAHFVIKNRYAPPVVTPPWRWKVKFRKELTADSTPGGSVADRPIEVVINGVRQNLVTDRDGYTEIGDLTKADVIEVSYEELMPEPPYTRVDYKGSFQLTRAEPDRLVVIKNRYYVPPRPVEGTPREFVPVPPPPPFYASPPGPYLPPRPGGPERVVTSTLSGGLFMYNTSCGCHVCRGRRPGDKPPTKVPPDHRQPPTRGGKTPGQGPNDTPSGDNPFGNPPK